MARTQSLPCVRGDVCERCRWQMQRAKRSGSGRNFVSVSEQEILGTATGGGAAKPRRWGCQPAAFLRTFSNTQLPAVNPSVSLSLDSSPYTGEPWVWRSAVLPCKGEPWCRRSQPSLSSEGASGAAEDRTVRLGSGRFLYAGGFEHPTRHWASQGRRRAPAMRTKWALRICAKRRFPSFSQNFFIYLKIFRGFEVDYFPRMAYTGGTNGRPPDFYRRQQ